MAHTPDHEHLIIDSTPSALHPMFSSSSAEIVLRSKDDVLFHVSSETLSRSSPWFRTMFGLPQTSPSQDAILMGENADVIKGLLSVVGGMDPPNLDNVDLIEAILLAADKYEMPLAISTMRTALFSPFLHASPIRLYGIACRMSWEKEAKLASSRTLTLDLLSPEVMVELVALEPKHRDKLIALHRRRRDTLADGLDDTTVFYANLRGAPSTQNIPLSHCMAPLDHGAWFAFKYAFIKRADRGGVGEELDVDFLPHAGAMGPDDGALRRVQATPVQHAGHARDPAEDCEGAAEERRVALTALVGS
ncbi:hypothetical protein LXA43DRAFT_268425 [Ganoderma leucocontextum]|nr:hypothetical protein LXA43DRAFT_268425 [Ganoderma leucocontextum]